MTATLQILQRLDRIETMLAEHGEELLSTNEAARFLNVSLSWLYKLSSTNAIPYYKPNGKKIIFRKSDLTKYLLRNRVKPVEEIEHDATDLVLGL